MLFKSRFVRKLFKVNCFSPKRAEHTYLLVRDGWKSMFCSDSPGFPGRKIQDGRFTGQCKDCKNFERFLPLQMNHVLNSITLFCRHVGMDTGKKNLWKQPQSGNVQILHK